MSKLRKKTNKSVNTQPAIPEGSSASEINLKNIHKNKRTKFIFITVLIGLIAVSIISCFIIFFINKNNNKVIYADGTGIKTGVSEESSKDEPNLGLITPKATLSPEQMKENSIEEAEEKEQKLKEEKEQKRKEEKISALIEQADNVAMSYDYDKAINIIKSYGNGYQNEKALMSAISRYEGEKKCLDPLGAYDSVDQISHIFFHSLIVDTKKAFNSEEANGYNYYMTTVTEFNNMMQQMYDKGYVLVSIHDVAKAVKEDDGSIKFTAGDILLPPDKKPFVLSQDDVNYYPYMDGDGFASRIVIDENGRPSAEMVMDDGSVKRGDFDMVPALETFIAKHPDFSYRGARGILALTGYEGTLGYRTNNMDSPTYEQDKTAVKNVVKVLKEYGWEFASHSYGHRDMQKYSFKFLKKDTDRWLKEVGSLIGPTDIYVFPYGIDIETSMKNYSSNKYQYLKKSGFDYYCGVYKEPWIQVNHDYVRMTRRPLDGQAMLQFPERLADLFNLKTIVDPSRPKLK